MEERIDLVVEDEPRTDGVSTAILVSLILHAVIAIYIIATYKPVGSEKIVTPIVHYVELMRQNKDFVEAPGAKQKTAAIDAPLSDANRKASTPHPTGDTPTRRPGDGSSRLWSPPSGSPRDRTNDSGARPQGTAPQQSPSAPALTSTQASAMSFRQPVQQQNTSGIDWHSAIREVSKVASLGGKEGLDLGQGGGGDKGYAANGEPSFETQWFDWGEYAEGMVRRIRVNWLSVMPDLIKTGMRGHLVVRVTIHRDGSLSDIEILQNSGIPPYDFAAKKALEMSSPIAPLPKDFPNETERVTFGFFYNEEPPIK